jgi:hypothetical protein
MSTGSLPTSACKLRGTQKTDAERKAFLDMAKSWTKAAAQMTNGEAIAPPAAPAGPKASP